MDANDLNDLMAVLKNLKSAKHDLNNLFNNVLTAVDLLKDKINENDSLTYLAKQIESNTILASEILTNVFPNSSIEHNNKRIINLNLLIKDTAKLVTNNCVELQVGTYDTEYFMLGHYIEIQRVLINLITNAIEAKNKNPIIQIELEHLSNSAIDNFIVLSITDNGHGINNRNMNKLFENGFSTKENSSNRGLGLGIVQEIIKNHDGYIEVTSKPNEGSTFKLFLPIYNRSSAEQYFGNKSVVIAEDDNFQREVLGDLLKSMNINVFTASNGLEALNLFYSEKPDLLFIDDKMPIMNGMECINEIRTKDSLSPIVLVTGARLSDINLESKLFKVLSKPYNFDDVRLLLSELL